MARESEIWAAKSARQPTKKSSLDQESRTNGGMHTAVRLLIVTKARGRISRGCGPSECSRTAHWKEDGRVSQEDIFHDRSCKKRILDPNTTIKLYYLEYSDHILKHKYRKRVTYHKVFYRARVIRLRNASSYSFHFT
jgi:hypothetical protein